MVNISLGKESDLSAVVAPTSVSGPPTVRHSNKRNNMSRTTRSRRIFRTLGAAVENNPRVMMRVVAKLATIVLISAGLGLVGLGAGTAQANVGPFRWCPGGHDRLPNPNVVWDMSVCHTYWLVAPGLGNTDDGLPQHDLWDGDNPPLPPPPAPCPFVAPFIGPGPRCGGL